MNKQASFVKRKPGDYLNKKKKDFSVVGKYSKLCLQSVMLTQKNHCRNFGIPLLGQPNKVHLILKIGNETAYSLAKSLLASISKLRSSLKEDFNYPFRQLDRTYQFD